MKPYESHLEHLEDWLGWLRRRLEMELESQSGQSQGGNPLYISDDEVRRLLQTSGSGPSRDQWQKLRLLEEDIRTRVELTREKTDLLLPFARLEKLFSLSVRDKKILLLALAPEISPQCGKIFAFLQDDMTARLPSIRLMLNLFGRRREEEIPFRKALDDNSPLLFHRLLYKVSSQKNSPALSQSLRIEERVTAFLLNPHSQAPFSNWVKVFSPRRSWDDILIPPGLKSRLARVQTFEKDRPVLQLRGPEDMGKDEAVEAFGADLGSPVIEFNLTQLPRELAVFEETLRGLDREVRLQEGILYLKGIDDYFFRPDMEKQFPLYLENWLEKTPYFTLLSGELNRRLRLPTRIVLDFDFTIPSVGERREFWIHRLGLSKEIASFLSSSFALSGPHMEKAVRQAQVIAQMEGKEKEFDAHHLQRACVSQAHHNLASLASEIEPRSTFDDIVLEEKALEMLREICQHIRHKHKIYGLWGFGQKYGDSNMAALFAGQSGTGKTMAAQVIAGEVGLDLFRIDLSRVVSKYIGETEKNLSRIFNEAERSHAILFFDEADALFGKRSEVESAHDRYANIETDYLLQRMENYGGVIILATNFQQNIDDAFMRRIKFLVEFPFPEREERYKIWKKIFPEDAPLADNVDFHFLAENFPISGGNIRNIALNAAFLAAEAKEINMEHIVLAARREYDKIGRRVTERDFGKYYELLGLEE